MGDEFLLAICSCLHKLMYTVLLCRQTVERQARAIRRQVKSVNPEEENFKWRNWRDEFTGKEEGKRIEK